MKDQLNVIKYASPPSRRTNTEKALYLVVRIGIAVAGLLVILLTLWSEFLATGLTYLDEPAGIPPLRDRLPRILLSLGIGLLLCVPHRWTTRGVLFWLRLALYLAMGGFILWLAGQGVIEGLGRGRHWLIFSVSAILALIGLALPFCLWWSRRIHGAA